MEKKIAAIHFGAGNIGRGLIAPLYAKNNIHTIFIDVDKGLISSLNKEKKYCIEYDDNSKEEISNFSAFNSIEELINEINKYDIKYVSTSIGTKNFTHIKSSIFRLMCYLKDPINFIAFENDFKASNILKDILGDEVNNYINCIVDRIVPKVKQETLDISTERHYEVILDSKSKNDNFLKNGFIWTNDFKPFLYRKLWLLNSTHLMIGYLFRNDNIYLYQMFSPEYERYQELRQVLNLWFKNIKLALIKEFNFNEKEIDHYISKTINRISSNLILDSTKRLRRDPIKKLKKEERVISLFLIFEKFNLNKELIIKLINEMLNHFDNDDEQSRQLLNEVSKYGKKKTLTYLTKLDEKYIDEILNII